jgi:hypothetical protein
MWVIATSDAAAWIGLATGVVGTLVGAWVAIRQSHTDERLERLKRSLEAEARAEEVLARYREPLASAAFDLQSRLYNILDMKFFTKYGEAHPRREEALRTTLFRLAQYFGWTEILRRDIQFLSFPEAQATRRVAELQADIAERFLTDADGQTLMIWADEQRAIGERMIVEEHDKVLCMGYARFRDECDDGLAPWSGRLRDQVVQDAARARMRDVQHLLCDLIETLDEHRVRYAEDKLKRALGQPSSSVTIS